VHIVLSELCQVCTDCEKSVESTSHKFVLFAVFVPKSFTVTLVEIWQNSDKNNFAQFFWDTVYMSDVGQFKICSDVWSSVCFVTILVITSPASGSEVLQLVCLFVCHTMYIMYWKYLMYTLHQLHQLVANFRKFFHLHAWCQHNCGRSLLSMIVLLSIAFVDNRKDSDLLKSY